MPDILDEGGAPPAPPAEPRAKKGYIVCDHCGCTLTQTGEVFKMSDAAKKHNKASDKIAELEGTITTLEGTAQTLRQEIEDLKAAAPEPVAVTVIPAPEKKFSIF